MTALLLATIATAGVGVEAEGPDARVGGVVEINLEVERQVSLQLLGRARHFRIQSDCGHSTSGVLYDGALGIRFDVLAPNDVEHALPFFGAGLGVEADGGASTLFYFNLGVDLFAAALPHLGLRLLFRVDAMDFARTDAGGALLLFARF